MQGRVTMAHLMVAGRSGLSPLHRGTKKTSNHLVDVVSMSGENIGLFRNPLTPNRQVVLVISKIY